MIEGEKVYLDPALAQAAQCEGVLKYVGQDVEIIDSDGISLVAWPAVAEDGQLLFVVPVMNTGMAFLSSSNDMTKTGELHCEE